VGAHQCRLLLAKALPVEPEHEPGYLRLIISHAKLDGLPLAHALKHQVEALGWARGFL
jgi:hypothetical protein